MDLTAKPADSLAGALAWLVVASAYVRFEAGPPSVVRVVVRDPLDAAEEVWSVRVVFDDLPADAAFLEAVSEVKHGVETAQAQGKFAFPTPDDRGWRPDGTPGWLPRPDQLGEVAT